MSAKVPVEVNTRRVRIALCLIVTWSVLQGLLQFAIYGLHVNAPTAYLMEIIPSLPIIAMIAMAARLSALKPDAFPRSYLFVIVVFTAALSAVGFLGVMLETMFFWKSLSATGLLVAFQLLGAMVPAFLLLMPKRMILEGGGLGDMLLPVRMKLLTPALRRISRQTAFLLIYIVCIFASRMLLGSNTPPTGVLAYAVALLPVLPLFSLIWVYSRYMAEEQDEFERHLFVQSILWAFLGTFIVVCAMERLEDYALIIHRQVGLFRLFSPVWVFYFFQIEAGFVIKAIQGARMKRNR